MTDQTPNNPMSFDDAHSMVMHRLYTPPFFAKLAQDFNIRPENDEQAAQMLQMAGKLRNAHEKQAAAQSPNSMLDAASQALDAQLVDSGLAEDPQTDNIKVAAAHLSKEDQELAHAILSIHTHAASA